MTVTWNRNVSVCEVLGCGWVTLMWWSGWSLAPACLRQKAVVVDFARGFPAVAIGPSQQNLLAVLLRAVFRIVCSLCKLKEANDRGNSGVELFV